MIIAYFQQHKSELPDGNINYSGFICPYNKESCMHMDSLSLTRTVNCNNCGMNRSDKKTQNSLNIKVLILNSN